MVGDTMNGASNHTKSHQTYSHTTDNLEMPLSRIGMKQKYPEETSKAWGQKKAKIGHLSFPNMCFVWDLWNKQTV